MTCIVVRGRDLKRCGYEGKYQSGSENRRVRFVTSRDLVLLIRLAQIFAPDLRRRTPEAAAVISGPASLQLLLSVRVAVVAGAGASSRAAAVSSPEPAVAAEEQEGDLA